METLYNLVVVTHLLGMGALVGGYLVAATRRADALVPNSVMVWGARLQVITGLVLVGLAESALDGDLNHTKIGVKLVVALAVAALTEIANARGRRGTAVSGLVHAAGLLGIVNVLVAALWK
jgi:hypothetical protein